MQHTLRLLLLVVASQLFSACGTFDRFLPASGEGRVARGPARVKIDLSAQRAYLYKHGEVFASSRISTGRDGFETPVGRYKVVQKDRDHRSTIYGDYVSTHGGVIRPGVDIRRDPKPSGAVFRGASMPYFLRFSGPIGMHAGNVPWYPASHGCVRLPAGMARTFYQNVPVGSPVIVTD